MTKPRQITCDDFMALNDACGPDDDTTPFAHHLKTCPFCLEGALILIKMIHVHEADGTTTPDAIFSAQCPSYAALTDVSPEQRIQEHVPHCNSCLQVAVPLLRNIFVTHVAGIPVQDWLRRFRQHRRPQNPMTDVKRRRRKPKK